MNSDYWNKFYLGSFSLDIPSQFCAMFCQEAPKGATVVEVGCGNGRDSRVMASHGFRVLGIDASVSAIEYCISQAGQAFDENLQYLNSDVTALEVDAVAKFVGDAPFYLYSRFFQHSITEEEQEQMLAALASIGNGQLTGYFEFRNELDRNTQKLFGEQHYRRYQTTDYFVDVLARHGFESVYRIEGKGYAKYFGEDPHVSRVIAKIPRKDGK